MPCQPLHLLQHQLQYAMGEAPHLLRMQQRAAERLQLMRGAAESLETYREEVYHRQPIPLTR